MSQCSGQGLDSLENTELIDLNFLVELRCQIFVTASDESKKWWVFPIYPGVPQILMRTCWYGENNALKYLPA